MYGTIILGMVSMFTLSFVVSQRGHFHAYWTVRAKEWMQATTFLQSENCANPLLRSRLGSFNLCDTSEQIVSRYPLMTAIHDVAQDLNICGHGRCSVFYMDITANIHKVVIGTVLLALIGLYVFRRLLTDRQIDKREYYYQLPSHQQRLHHRKSI